MSAAARLAVRAIGRRFGSVVALEGVSLAARAGEVLCLVGDNGAGKSTLIQLLSGTLSPSEGSIRIDGEPVAFRSPRDAQARGVATVFQDLALVPLLSVSRNFVLGREPTRNVGPLRWFDRQRADRETVEALDAMGIALRDPGQAVGTLSGGERQCVAIARAVHYGARVLILDEPTAALGVHQAGLVLRLIERARADGLAVILVTHNVHHAEAVGDRYAILSHGQLVAEFARGELTRAELHDWMAGGREGAA